MHVYVDGAWHRRLPDLSRTACGLKFNSQFSRLRREELKHPMRRCCFTEVEIAEADKSETAQFEAAENEEE